MDAMNNVHPLFIPGAEIVIRYSSPPGLIPVRIYLWGGTHLVYEHMHTVGASGALEVRLVCAPSNLRIYVGGELEHELDPGQITHPFDGDNTYYWMYLCAALPYDPVEPGPGWQARSDQWSSWRVYPGYALPHIREVLYYELGESSQPPFFRGFVKAYEIASAGSGAAPLPPADGGGGGTVLTIDTPPASPIPVESLPFQAVFNYVFGGGDMFPAVFTLALGAGTYKFSTALSPDREEHDTQIALYSFEEAAPLYVDDDISESPPSDHRSEITATLPAGAYALVVGTYGVEFGMDGAIDPSSSISIPAGTVLRVSKV